MSYMKMIYLDGNDACKTGVGAELETPQRTWEAFKSAKQIAVPPAQATFAIDYYNSKGDLNHTVHIDDAGFQSITGKPPQSAEFYRAHDAMHWACVRASLSAQRAAQAAQQGEHQ